jgi:hypothetical protein
MHMLSTSLFPLSVLGMVLMCFRAWLYQVVPVGRLAVHARFNAVRIDPLAEGLRMPGSQLFQWVRSDTRPPALIVNSIRVKKAILLKVDRHVAPMRLDQGLRVGTQ